MGDEFSDHNLGKSGVWHAVCSGLHALLHGTDAPFNLANMCVGGGDVEGSWCNVMAHTLELLVSVDITHVKTMVGVSLHDLGKVLEHGCARPVADGERVSVMELAVDNVEETLALDVEVVHAKGDLQVVCHDKGRQWSWDEGGHVCRWWPVGVRAFDEGDVGPIYMKSTVGVVGGDRRVEDVVVAKGVNEKCLGQATQSPIKVQGTVRSLQFAASKLGAMSQDRL